LGQGTLAREFEQQSPGLDALLVAVGGGGLLAGVVGWFQDRAEIVGVEPTNAPTLTRAIEAGHPVDAQVGSICIDSLAPRQVGTRVFATIRDRVKCVVLVSDAAIREAQLELWNRLRIVAEPGGCAAFAAVLSGEYDISRHQRIGIVVSGGNTTAVTFSA
jgi:threonine dehydratase